MSLTDVLLLIAIIFYMPFAFSSAREWYEKKRRGNLPAPHTYRVVLLGGRAGWVYFLENGHACAFGYEYMSAPSVMWVDAPAAVAWDTRYPWATGRRQEILTLVGDELISKTRKRHQYRIEDAGISVEVRN